MLHLILGCAGSGKTHWIREKLCAFARQPESPKLLLLVPEQYSFESERAILRLLGPQMAQKVEVMSFRRLAELVFRQYGHHSGKILEEGGRHILMSLALEQVADELSFYREYTQTGELISRMLSVVTEWKQCGISAEQFIEVAPRIEDDVLQTKMRDVTRIVSAYDALVKNSYLDPLDDLSRAKQDIIKNEIFRGYRIGIDSFKGFTPQELEILECMFVQAEEVYLALCADGLGNPEQEMDLFAPTRHTIRQVISLAKKERVPVAKPTILEPGARFRQNPALAWLEQSIFRSGENAYLQKDWKGISLYSAGSRYEEAAFAAAKIRQLVMQEGYRYRDFVIITRSLEAYRGVLATAFREYEIPYFMDNPRRVDADPLLRLVLSAFQVVQSSFSSGEIFVYLKTGLVQGLDPYAISLLENYTYLWKLSGKKWKESWTAHPRGFVQDMTPEDTAQLEEVERLRELVMGPLLRFSKRIQDADGEQMCRAVYDLLQDVHADACFLTLCETLSQSEREAQAQEQLRLWDILMGMLDQTASILRGTVLSAKRFAELLRLVMACGDLSSIPQGMDEVTVGEAGRVRPDEPKVTLVMGAVQGEFPAVPSETGAFCDRERQTLISFGLPLASTLEADALEERFLVYTSLASPSEALFVTWRHTASGGGEQFPSAFVREIQRMFPSVPVETAAGLSPLFFASTREAAFEWTAREYRQDSCLSASLKQWFSREEEGRFRLDALQRASCRPSFSFAEPETALAMFPARFHASATQIETYHLCRFQYFCRYGLQIRERRPAELNPLEYGSLMHYLLEKMFAGFGAAAIAAMDGNTLKETVTGYLEEYVEGKMGGAQDKTPRFLTLLERLADSACVIIYHMAQELEQSEFTAQGYEMSIGKDGDFPSLSVELPEGGKVEIDGVIDRVDVWENEGETYVRIVDYKTGKKEFRLSDVLYGVNMQMLLYLAAVLEGRKEQAAGILYMPAVRPVVSGSRHETPSQLEKALDKQLRMNGLLVDNLRLLEAMEPGGGGRYLPVTVKDGKASRRDSLLTRSQMDWLLGQVKQKVRDMAHGLHRGQVQAVPLKGTYDACRYCPYFPVCGHEEEQGGIPACSYSKDAVLERLRGEGDGTDGE